jgi:hypothetical protein
MIMENQSTSQQAPGNSQFKNGGAQNETNNLTEETIENDDKKLVNMNEGTGIGGTDIRGEDSYDIIKGARDTSQLDKMKENASQDSSVQSTQVPLPTVNNGSISADDI